MKRYITLILVFIITPILCYCQYLVDAWNSYSLPKKEKTIEKYNRYPIDWTVFLKSNKVFAIDFIEKIQDTLPFKIIRSEQNDKFDGRRSVISVDDGYLVGFFRGEWGGNLFWFSKDGKNNYEISSDRIVQFIKRNEIIYAIEGLYHMEISEGNILQIGKSSNKWVAKTYLKLPSAPAGIELNSNKDFVIITHEDLIIVDSNQKINYLIEKGFWKDGLYPNSIVIKVNTAYIGMRRGILSYNLKSHRKKWLMKN